MDILLFFENYIIVIILISGLRNISQAARQGLAVLMASA